MTDTVYVVALRQQDGEIDATFADIAGGKARAINMAWYLLGRYGGRGASAELYAGPAVEAGPAIWEDAANLVLRVEHPPALVFEPDDTPFP